MKIKHKLLIAAALLFIMVAFTKKKTYRLELDEGQINTLLIVVDQSTAPHTQVKAVQGWLEQQLIPQIDTLKK